MKTSAFIFLLFLVLVTSFLSDSANATDLRILGHRIPPFSMHTDDGQIQGFSAELFKQVFRKIYGPDKEANFRAVTFNRLYTELQHGVKRIGITVGRNPEREKLFKWVGPYFSVNLGVIAKKKRNFKIKTPRDFEHHSIATIENTAPEQSLLKMGVHKNNLNRDLFPARSIQKLAQDRVDFMAYPLQAASYLMTQKHIYPGDYEEVFHLKKIDLYFALSQDFSDEDVRTWQTHLDQVLASEFFKDLKNKYALDGIAKYIPHNDQ